MAEFNEASFFETLEAQVQISEFVAAADIWLPAVREGQEVLLNRQAGEDFRQELLEDYALLRHDVREADYSGAYAEGVITDGITESVVDRLCVLPGSKLPLAVRGPGIIRAPKEGDPMHHLKLGPKKLLFGDVTGVEYGNYCGEDAMKYPEVPPTRGIMLWMSNVAICFDVEHYPGSQGATVRPDIDTAMLPIAAQDLQLFQVFPKI